MSLVLYGLGIIMSGVVGGVMSDIAVSLSANMIHDNLRKVYDSITIRKGRNDLQTLHPVIESALVSSFYNAIILNLTKTRDYFKRTSSYIYKKEILQITARIKELTHLLNGRPSGYAILLDRFCEVMNNSTSENINRLVALAKNNLIGLPEKAQTDLEDGFIGMFLILIKENYASDEIFKSLLTFDMLQTNLQITTDTSKKLDSLICAYINIETELNNISSAVLDLPTYNDHAEIRSMLNGIQQTLTNLAQSKLLGDSSNLLLQQSYLDVVYSKYKYVEFPSFDGVKKRINIKDIYVPLELINRIAVTIDNNGQLTKMAILDIDEYNKSNSSSNPFLIEKMTVFDIIPRYKKAFITGESGMGKSITAQHIICCLSGYQSMDADFWNEERLKIGLTDSEEIPIYISLEKYFRYGDFGKGAKSILEYVQKEFSLQDNLIEFLKTKLVTGKATLIVKDCSFSEIPASGALIDISDFINNYSRCRYIIFRSAGNEKFYEQYTIFDDIPRFELSRLSVKTMREITEKYCDVIAVFNNVDNFSFEHFIKTIKKLGLQELSEKPYWFGYLLLMNAAFEELPNNALSIHTRIIDNMLNRLLSLCKNYSEADKQNAILAFELLAVKMFLAIMEGNLISKELLQEVLEKYLPSEKALELMNKIKLNDCELLIYSVTDGKINYAHRSLISALVARYFRRHMESITTLIDYTFKALNIWIEALTLMFNESNYDLLAFVLFILQNTNDIDKDVKTKISLNVLAKVNVMDFSSRSERKSLVKSVLAMGKEILNCCSLSINDRISIAQDMSIISTDCQLLVDCDTYFKKIPAGIVILGNDRLTQGEPYEYNITYDYYAAKYPITNLEYQQFLAENPHYELPFDESCIWDVHSRCVDRRYLNHPVVGVSFHDAIKYCQWINEKMDILEGYKVWLPSDPEWMKMYRGGKEINGTYNTIPDRIYPWGNEWIEGYGNLPKLKDPICSTTAVGIFVEGVTQYGCYDSCGNVLEWTTTSWGGTNPDTPEYHHPYTPLDGREDLSLPGLRITRGGSFLFSEGDAKCSCRLDPESKFPDTGFRIFLVPNKSV